MVLSNLLLLGSLSFTSGTTSATFVQDTKVMQTTEPQYLSTSSENLLLTRDLSKLVFKVNTEKDLRNFHFRILGLPNDSKNWFAFNFDSDNIFTYNLANTSSGSYFTSVQFAQSTEDAFENFNVSSIDVYMQNSTSENLGTSILDSIKSGLNLMEDLATEFLNGFSALFWKDNQLTTFGQFSLIFLGISITFAIVKLCLNLIRGKTGA